MLACVAPTPRPEPVPLPPVTAPAPVAPAPAAPTAPAVPDIPEDAPPVPVQVPEAGPPVRVAIRAKGQEVEIASTGAWRLFDERGALLTSQSHGSAWLFTADGPAVRMRREDGRASLRARRTPVEARPAPGTMLVVDGRRYRGTLRIIPTDSGLLLVNHLPLEQYLRGVVPREIGPRTAAERAAVEAQAIAARSYAWQKVRQARSGPFDLLPGVLDQVYGGADGETPVADAAIAATAGLVLFFDGRVVSAPFHAACGGSTESPSDVWRGAAEPFLRRVSDTIPGTNRVWCEGSPRIRWTLRLTQAELRQRVDTYLPRYAATPRGSLGAVTRLRVAGRTPSGRASGVTFATERGEWTLRANDARFVLRAANGEILNSAYFDVAEEHGADGTLVAVTLRGDGHGHGVGLCQWGAIGRARAGQDARTILATYYPGTTVGPAPPLLRPTER
jgi:stage II sporulation protein D